MLPPGSARSGSRGGWPAGAGPGRCGSGATAYTPAAVNDGRYSRQTLFSPIGEAGQERIAASRVLVVGAGALGCSALDHLARAGVGKLRFVDRDTVELSNLQRQSLYEEADAAEGIPKTEAARRRLARVNAGCLTEPLALDLHAGNIRSVLEGVALIVDATDNFETRYLLNDAAVEAGLPWIYAACVGSYGMTFTVVPGETACLRCVIPDLPPPGSSPTCDTAGVIAPAVAAVMGYAVAEALKLLSGRREDLATGIWHLDVWERSAYRMEVGGPDPDCPACGLRQFPFLSAENAGSSLTLCGRNAVQVRPAVSNGHAAGDEPGGDDLFSRLAARLEALPETRGSLRASDHLLQFEVGDRRLVVFPDGRTIVHGSSDPAEARTLFSRYVGN